MYIFQNIFLYFKKIIFSSFILNFSIKCLFYIKLHIYYNMNEMEIILPAIIIVAVGLTVGTRIWLMFRK
jgi:hypothetical protein